jgi:hypothetical protein
MADIIHLPRLPREWSPAGTYGFDPPLIDITPGVSTVFRVWSGGTVVAERDSATLAIRIAAALKELQDCGVIWPEMGE